jgi:hypothetical protein
VDSEEFDERELDLNEAQLLAIRGVAGFASSDVMTALDRHGTLSPVTSLASLALGAAVQVVQSGLPSCPYAPPGKPISVQFLPPNNVMVLRCAHTPQAHCWDNLGLEGFGRVGEISSACCGLGRLCVAHTCVGLAGDKVPPSGGDPAQEAVSRLLAPACRLAVAGQHADSFQQVPDDRRRGQSREAYENQSFQHRGERTT